MKELESLISAGYKYGYTNGHGADDTVSGLEWAMSHLSGEGDTAAAYSSRAASDLESRLFAAYVLRCLAALKDGDAVKARLEYFKICSLISLIGVADDEGQIRSVSEEKMTAVLLTLQEKFHDANIER